jgi:16S rRNA (guanine(527)-N(7))-methyltransferase RsmG
MKSRPIDKALLEFVAHIKPTDHQIEQFEKYASYLLSCNEQFNLTAITDVAGVYRQHFEDSVMLSKFRDMSKVSMIADIGSGAGFPGIPLKIMYPHLKVVLIEVTYKKQQFLEDVIKLLELTDIEVCGMDWRTFVRHAEYPIDLFVTRAAFDELELMRIFRPACRYKDVELVYWASKQWEPHKKALPFIAAVEMYPLGHKERRLAFLRLPQEQDTVASATVEK